VLGIFPGAGRWRTCLPTRSSFFSWLCSMGGKRIFHWCINILPRQTSSRPSRRRRQGSFLPKYGTSGENALDYPRKERRCVLLSARTIRKIGGETTSLSSTSPHPRASYNTDTPRHWWPWVPQSTPKILLVKLFSTVRADLMPLFLLDCLHESCSQDSGGQCKHSNSENGDYACAELAHGGDRIHISISDGR
jgi:hypothetical protein